MVTAKKPTGNPDCPPEIREAKRIYHDIEGRVALGIVNDDPVPDNWEKGVKDASPEPDLEVDETSMFVGEDDEPDTAEPTAKHRRLNDSLPQSSTVRPVPSLVQ